MLAKVARHQTRLSVVAAARAGTDDERDLPAGVEFGNRLRRGAFCGEEHGSREQKSETVHRAPQSIHARTETSGDECLKDGSMQDGLNGPVPTAVVLDSSCPGLTPQVGFTRLAALDDMQNSGRPEFCWHPSKRSASLKKMDCRVVSAFTRVFRRAMPGNDGG